MNHGNRCISWGNRWPATFRIHDSPVRSSDSLRRRACRRTDSPRPPAFPPATSRRSSMARQCRHMSLNAIAWADDLATGANEWTGPTPVWQYLRAPYVWELERGLAWYRLARTNPRCSPATLPGRSRCLTGRTSQRKRRAAIGSSRPCGYNRPAFVTSELSAVHGVHRSATESVNGEHLST